MAKKKNLQIDSRKTFGTITDKKIGILGFSFKANTNDTRESSAIQISKDLLNEGANLIIYDPKVKKQQIESALSMESRENHSSVYSQPREWIYTSNMNDVFKSSDCVVFMTEWKAFSEINWKKVARDMRHPSWVFDTRGIIDKTQVIESGLNYWKVGNGESLNQFNKNEKTIIYIIIF